LGVLVLHGFTGSPWEVAPLAEYLRAAGHSVAVPRLPGHGTSLEDLDRTGPEDWLVAARLALETLAASTSEQHVVGFSMGGLLACRLLQETRVPALRSCTLLAPAFSLGPAAERAILLLETLRRRTGFPRFIHKGPFDLPGDLPDPPAYRGTSVAATARLVEFAVQLRTLPIRPDVPLLWVQGDADRTVPLAVVRRLLQRIVGPRLLSVTMCGGRHLLLRDPLTAGRLCCLVRAHVEANRSRR